MFKRPLLAAVFALLSHGVIAGQDPTYPFAIENVKEDGGYEVVARNGGPASVSVKVTLVNSQDVTSDRVFPIFAVVPADGGKVSLAHIRPARARTNFRFSIQSSWLIGDFQARHNASTVYRLPYKEGMNYPVIGTGPWAPGPGTSSGLLAGMHFAMPRGALVLAARDGTVIDSGANHAGSRVAASSDALNEVRVQHADGTIATYGNLDKRGVYVASGQGVRVGESLGFVGSTGASSASYLRFAIEAVVRSGDDLAVVSLPFQFYIGSPPVRFAPRLDHPVAPDERSSSPQVDRQAPVPIVASEAAPRAKSAAPIPRPPSRNAISKVQRSTSIRSQLLRVRPWQWMVIALGLIWLVVTLRNKRPRASGSRPGPATRLPNAKERLIVACRGDRKAAERLIAYELRKTPGISLEEAAIRALEILQRDRK